ncbi:hypothetical protein KL905_004442 [Ogataea polymorpha]|uniref:Uncharacterized protein n=1 Tax=Ogataea polymorpha TaxID=460523 RepID=A0A1B7SHQ5_9ASCO|nr:uncharacterized protein OGAPODRAFT_100910 [Ogataea polymorpha]KAG7877629.1 hypothetical protein KL937_004499 [Ogataea polymorpha]KAG7887198.1 hypothetical protein KL936_004719 [Ogataea polymorpha]KAG7906287.1 hypothetical protein KL906_004740 [Ogataea polymorpha]KAG7914221.1 hypothetical protein KL927_004872 [Ogataea polymorpha]KAG7917422.1 hypothetical protein KL905_004442 [Ogataea polymorpha]
MFLGKLGLLGKIPGHKPLINLRPGLLFVRTASRSSGKPEFRFKTRKVKTPEQLRAEEEQRKYEEAINSGSWIRKYGAIVDTFEFNRKATKYYLALYLVFFVYGIRYFRKLYERDVEKKELLEKRDSGAELSEWEKLRLRELSGDLIRTSDMAKLKAYHELREEWKKTHTSPDDHFNPKPEEIEHLLDTSYEECILPPKDLTDFYDNVAEKYDSEISTEEMLSFMGSKRKWLMSHCKGDVLEVACGTGRNIKYLDPTKIESYTFLDTSAKMMRVTYDKFTEQWPNFKKVKFVVGKAEDLLELQGDKQVKYDTIIETFGLCSHQDPVKALKNMMKLLKPGGRIVLLEHGRGSYDFINKQLDRRAHKHSETWGCRWNLDIGELVDASGLEITQEKRSHFGTTWTIVAKRPGDVLEFDELSFLEKYFIARKTNLDSSLPEK